ncbi:probable polygalacturonase At2g43860 [Amborella trichopoda]|uniref:probable polygalacturonase At2g43860 n=1 Tax=Amborella trichopoda TaxID=13333 RepID=UPI0009C00C8E|nr:probable polygalacturonase At2g43860 [Amborella trichopoda]|eukprot:XP_020520272.1 probable polygalacturonase At2g43860 [Amborella trichopoda]
MYRSQTIYSIRPPLVDHAKNLEGNLIASANINKVEDGSWLRFENVEGLEINKVEDGSGLEINGGVLDGKGARYWLYKEDDGDCPVGSNGYSELSFSVHFAGGVLNGSPSLVFNKCKNVSVNNLTSMSSKMFHIIFYESGRVRIYGVKVRAPANRPNTDGIHVEGSSDVLITDANIHTGDDCISIRPGTHDMWVEQMPTFGKLQLGSLGQYLDEPAVSKKCRFLRDNEWVKDKDRQKDASNPSRDIEWQDVDLIYKDHEL